MGNPYKILPDLWFGFLGRFTLWNLIRSDYYGPTPPPPKKKKMDQNFLWCQFVVDPPKHTQTLSEVVASTGSIFIAILKSLLIVLRCLGLRIFLMDQFFLWFNFVVDPPKCPQNFIRGYCVDWFDFYSYFKSLFIMQNRLGLRIFGRTKIFLWCHFNSVDCLYQRRLVYL